MNEYTIRSLAQKAMLDRPFVYTSLFPPSPYYRFLKQLAAEMQPSLSVVLGVCGGGCCLHLAQGHIKGIVVGIDNAFDHPHHIQYIKQNHANFVFWLGDSVDDAMHIYKDFGKIDILFIDTVHTYERTMTEYLAWKPYLSDRAVICLDDLFRPGMQQAWDELPDPKVRLDELHDGAEDGGGFGVLWNG